MDNNEKHEPVLHIYSNRSILINEDGIGHQYDEGRTSEEAKRRLLIIKEALTKGFLENVIEECKNPEVDIENITEEQTTIIESLVNSVTSEVGRAIVGLTVLQLTVKSILPAQSIRLHKDIGVSQKTAWFMLHRIRKTLGLHQSDEKLDGICEADETYIGGQEKNKHWDKKTKGTQGRSIKTKIIVGGVIERGGELRAMKLDSTNAATLGGYISSNVKEGSRVNTDEWLGYKKLHKNFDHRVVNHKNHEYVIGDAHTNTLEGFWAMFKRGIRGVYHIMSAKHIQQYIDEYVFRYNTREMSEAGRFNWVLGNSGVQLKYENLVN